MKQWAFHSEVGEGGWAVGCERQVLGQRRNCHTDAAWRNAADVGAAKLRRELTAGVTCSGVTPESDIGP